MIRKSNLELTLAVLIISKAKASVKTGDSKELRIVNEESPSRCPRLGRHQHWQTTYYLANEAHTGIRRQGNPPESDEKAIDILHLLIAFSKYSVSFTDAVQVLSRARFAA